MLINVSPMPAADDLDVRYVDPLQATTIAMGCSSKLTLLEAPINPLSYVEKISDVMKHGLTSPFWANLLRLFTLEILNGERRSFII